MKEVIVIILFILDKKLEVKDVLSTDGDIGYSTPFFDDEFKQYLDTGAETYKFSTMANTKQSQYLVVGNYIAFSYKGQHKLFQIMNIDEEHNESFMKTVYCEMAGIELINNIVRPMQINNADIKKFVQTILSGTEWQLGLLDIGVSTVQDIKITDYTNVYSALQQHAVQEYGAEISLTVKIENNRVVAKYVNIYRERGKKNGFRFAYESNISSITRTVDSSNLATALIGVGKNNITFKEVDAPDKPLNQDFIADEESYKRWNQNGLHVMGLFKCDSESPQELLKLTRKELDKRKNPNVKYELKTELLGKDEVGIGDTVNVVDYEFNPPIFLEARVNELSISFTDSEKNECVLANYKEVGTKITDQLRGLIDSKFPIHSEDIADGAVGKDQISIQYHTQLIADAVHASLVETEDLIATKADIEELRAVEAKIGTLEAGQVIAEELKAIKGTINTLESDKANIKDLDVIKGSITHLESEKIDTKEFNAEVANIKNTITNNLYATNAEIEKLKAKDAEIGNLVSENAKLTNAEIEKLKAKDAQIDNAIINKANITDLNATNATVENLKTKVAEIDKAVIDNLTATNAEIDTLKTNYANITTLIADKASIKDLNATNATVSNLDAKVANIDKAVVNNLNATNAEIAKLKVKDAEIDKAIINKANVSDLNAINASIDKLKAKDAEIDKAIINKADISSLNVIQANIDSMKVKVAEIDALKAKDGEFENLLAGNLTAKNFKAGAITAGSAIIADGAIGSAQISSLVANKIVSGEIDTGKVKVKSTNGEIELSGYQILVNDTTNISNKINRVILGKYTKADNTTDYGLLIRGKDGKTVMMDADGVHNAGLTNGSVDNNKIADNANIDGKKLNIESVVTKINGATTKIDGTSIVVDNKSLGATISSIQNTQTAQGQELKQAKSDIQASIDSIKLSVSNVNTTITNQGTQIQKNSSDISLQQDQINLKVDANGVISAINVDASGIAINGEKIDLNGCVNFNSLNSNPSEFGGLFDKEFNQTVINGGRILTNSIKAQQIDIYGLTARQKQADGTEIETFKISDDGSVKLRGDIESFDYNERENTGWKLSKEGTAVLNDALVRGSVILPNAGITEFGGVGNPNLLYKSDTTDLSAVAGHVGSASTSTAVLVDEPTAPKGKAIKITKTNNAGTTSSSGGRYFILKEKLPQGKTYTWSIKVKGNGVLNSIGCEQGGTKSVTLTDEYQEVTHTFTVNSSQYYQFVMYGSGNFDVTFHSIKLEEGSKATPWTYNDSENQNLVRMWAGASYGERHNAPFRVMQNGDIYAENGTFKGTFTGRIEIGNILIEDTVGGNGTIKFQSETGVNVVDIEEDEVKIGVNTTIGTDSSKVSITKTDTTIVNKDVNIVRTENGKSHTVVQIDSNSNEFMHLNGTHKLITNGSTLVVEGNQTEFTNNIVVRNSIATNDMIVGNMQMKRRTEDGNKGIDFIFV
ncbi:hypothetical protein UT300009_29710 [Paraclostridium bifermentans]